MKISILIAALTLTCFPMTNIAQTGPGHLPKLERLTPEEVHRRALVIDTHEDTPQRFVEEHFDLSDPLNGGQIILAAIHKGHLGESFMSIGVEPDLYKGDYAR